MIHMLAERISSCLIKNEVGKIEHKEYYTYGMERIIEKLITYSVLLALALHYKLLTPSLLWVAFFVLLRGYTGGFHANTFLGCFVGTLVMYLLYSQIAAPYLLSEKVPLFPVLAITVILILVLSPINHPNLGLSSKELEKCRRGRNMVLIIETVIIVGGMAFGVNKRYIVFPLLGMVMCAILLILAKIIKQEVKVDEGQQY